MMEVELKIVKKNDTNQNYDQREHAIMIMCKAHVSWKIKPVVME